MHFIIFFPHSASTVHYSTALNECDYKKNVSIFSHPLHYRTVCLFLFLLYYPCWILSFFFMPLSLAPSLPLFSAFLFFLLLSCLFFFSPFLLLPPGLFLSCSLPAFFFLLFLSLAPSLPLYLFLYPPCLVLISSVPLSLPARVPDYFFRLSLFSLLPPASLVILPLSLVPSCFCFFFLMPLFISLFPLLFHCFFLSAVITASSSLPYSFYCLFL